MHDYKFPQAPYGDQQVIDHAKRWLAHVEQGRIGASEHASPGQLARHRRNEAVLRAHGQAVWADYRGERL